MTSSRPGSTPTGTPQGLPDQPPSPPTTGGRQVPSGSPATGGTGGSTADTAKAQAASVADGATEAAKDVAGTAKEQVGEVAHEARKQAQDLLGQARTELTDQARTQQQRVAGGLHQVSDQLRALADGEAAQGPATDLTHQAAEKVAEVARFFENRDPGDLLDEVRRYAQRRPGMFLALALGAGVVAGRLTRGLTADTDTPSAAGATGRPTPEGPRPAVGPATLTPGSPYGVATGGVDDPTGLSFEPAVGR